jgi:prepilin-type N-terminal cleavage/methylation domain-containing protein
MIEREDGYTIVELLVVLVLVGLITTAISAGLQFGTRVWERSEVSISAAQGYQAAQEVLRSLLSSATPRMEDGLVGFHGEPDFLAFDALPPRALCASGLARIELTIVPKGETRALEVRVTSLIDRRKSRTVELAGNLGNARFAYLDATEKVPSWLDFWRDRPHMPQAVRLAAGDMGRSESWPPFVARVPIAQDARCDFDPVSTDCRRK